MDQVVSGYNNRNLVEDLSLPAETPALSLDTSCPVCGMTRRELYAAGRMGCAKCYLVFEPEVLHAIREIHGAIRHNFAS